MILKPLAIFGRLLSLATALLCAVVTLWHAPAAAAQGAEDGDIVQIMLCFEDQADPQACSQQFISLCLDQSKGTSEQPGMQRACLLRLTEAWVGIHEGLLRRTATTFTGDHRARLQRYVADWAKYDESACAFIAMEFAPANREMEEIYCKLQRVLKRAEFLIAAYDSAQVRDPRLPLK